MDQRMDPQKQTKAKRIARLTKSRAVQSSSESSSDEKSEEEPHNLGSRIKLLREKRKSAKSLSSKKSTQEECESTIVQIESGGEPAKSQLSKEQPSLAQSIKRKFGFFRKSDNAKSPEDVEAAVVESSDAGEGKNKQTVDVVVDVHCESENPKAKVIKRRVSSKSSNDLDKSDEERKKSPGMPMSESLDLIEEFREERSSEKRSSKSNLFEAKSEEEEEEEEEEESEIELNSVNDQSIDELTNDNLPTSGADSSRRRKRWEKSEISAEHLVEDLTKPKRRQWKKGAASADFQKATAKKITLPKRSATADVGKSTGSRSSKFTKPIAAPRSKRMQRDEVRGFDNDGFSSDHDEVLRIETINNSSPKIKIGSAEMENIEDGASTLSEEELDKLNSAERKSSIVEVKEYLPKTPDSTEDSDGKMKSLSETNDSTDFLERKSVSRRRSSAKRKSSSEKRSADEEEEIEEEEEEQETVMNAMDKKSRRSSSSSKVQMIPSNFFEKKSSDETTISTSEDMQTSRKDSRRSRSRSKSKSARREKSSSRSKRKTTSSSTRNSTEENSRKSKSRKKKRRKKREKSVEDLEEAREEMKYVSIRIHRSDILEADYVTRHPMVKVHIVYAETGEYLKVHNKDEKEAGLLQPIITAKFDFMERRSMVPVWEEELIFEQDFKDLLVEGRGAALILFEIVDLLTFTEASLCYDQFGRDACWYKVAWAFLRPVGVSGARHIDKKLRLQLYRPRKSFRRAGKNKCEVYKWWKSGSRDKYPSSLYVSVTTVDPPKLEPVFYEQLLQLHDWSEMQSDSQNLVSAKTDEEMREEAPKWTRLAAQSCQIPNETYLETEASDNGCFHLAFSHDGKFLACALSEEYDYPILVYKIDEGKIYARFSGHKNFVYSLSWSQDDRYLLSVSSDQTSRFWDVREKIIEPIQSLPHPSYVYCGKFFPDTSNCIVTGCYDHVARIWARLRPGNNDRQYELVQELEAHDSFVNALCFQTKDESFLSGDGNGLVILWIAKKSRKSPVSKEWQIARKIKIRELEGIPINSLVMHPLGSRLLVHSRNNGLRLIDLTTGVTIKKFEGLKNKRIQIRACISPCGSLLFCGGEDSSLNVWSVESGKLLGTYEIESREKAITCVDYHPYDHVLAFATYGAPEPIKILKFDREADGKKVGLKLVSMATSNLMSVNSSARMKEMPRMIRRNGSRHVDKLSARSLNCSTNASQVGSVNRLLAEYKEEAEVRQNLKGKLQKFMEPGPNFKAKSMSRLNGIIEKIDRILMYATSQKSPAFDLEASILPFEERRQGNMEFFELENMSTIEEDKNYSRKSRKERERSRSARNACSPTAKEIEYSKALSDSVAFMRKVSRFSDDSSNSNRSAIHERFVVERLELDKIDCVDTESGFKDSLDTIVDGKEDFPSEEALDVESLKSDDTYVVDKDKKSSDSRGNDSSEKSNATFIIESEIPVPKPRRRSARIEVM